METFLELQKQIKSIEVKTSTGYCYPNLYDVTKGEKDIRFLLVEFELTMNITIIAKRELIDGQECYIIFDISVIDLNGNIYRVNSLQGLSHILKNVII